MPNHLLDILIVGGSPEPSTPALLRQLAFSAGEVVACDKGCAYCRQAGVAVHTVIGDLDSAHSEDVEYAKGCGARFMTFPADKDETDLELALEYAEEQCARRREQGLPKPTIGLTCFSGGRLDHWLAVLGVLARYDYLESQIFEDDYTAIILEAGSVFDVACAADLYALIDSRLEGTYVNRTISLLSLDGEAVVSEDGMKWDLDHVTLRPLSDLGVSNIVYEGDARVEVHTGTCILIFNEEFIEKDGIGHL